MLPRATCSLCVRPSRCWSTSMLTGLQSQSSCTCARPPAVYTRRSTWCDSSRLMSCCLMNLGSLQALLYNCANSRHILVPAVLYQLPILAAVSWEALSRRCAEHSQNPTHILVAHAYRCTAATAACTGSRATSRLGASRALSRTGALPSLMFAAIEKNQSCSNAPMPNRKSTGVQPGD